MTDAIDHRLTGEPRCVMFHRAEGFYMLDLPGNDDLSAHAECNPGTLKITDAITGEILWAPQ